MTKEHILLVRKVMYDVLNEFEQKHVFVVPVCSQCVISGNRIPVLCSVMVADDPIDLSSSTQLTN